VVLRLLDKEKVKAQKTLWQLLNIGIPVAMVLLTGFIFQWWRREKFAAAASAAITSTK
jgi:hypothetical protein